MVLSCACFVLVLFFLNATFKGFAECCESRAFYSVSAAGREKLPKLSHQVGHSINISEFVTYLSWSSFAIIWFLPFTSLQELVPPQELLFCWCDLITKSCSSVLVSPWKMMQP